MNTALLLSGGIDSIAVCHWKRPTIAITIDYGQTAAEAELASSLQVCRTLGIPHDLLVADCSEVGLGNMVRHADRDIQLPQPLNVPSPEWWPFRNQLLITLAASHCVRLGCDQLLIGTVKSDSQHKDGSPEFLMTMNELLQCQEGRLSLDAPAIHMSSTDLVQESKVPMSVLAWAHSCHVASIPCGECRGCWKYRQVFNDLNEAEEWSLKSPSISHVAKNPGLPRIPPS